MQHENYLVCGETGSGKSNLLCHLVEDDVKKKAFVVIDAQDRSTARTFAKMCVDQDTPVILDNPDDGIVPGEFLKQSGDKSEDEKTVEIIADSIGTMRGTSLQQQVLTMEYLIPALKLMLYQNPKKPIGRGIHAFNSKMNRVLLAECTDLDTVEEIMQKPGSQNLKLSQGVSANRAMNTFNNPKVKERDIDGFDLIDFLNSGGNYCFEWGRGTTVQANKLLGSVIETKVLRAVEMGLINREVCLIKEEASIQGVSPYTAQLMGSGRKLGLSIILISQDAEFADDFHAITKKVTNNANVIFMSSNAPHVLNLAASMMAAVYSPTAKKASQWDVRTRLVGYDMMEMESETSGGRDSVTKSLRVQPVYKNELVEKPIFFNGDDFTRTYKKAVAGQKVGEGIVVSMGKVSPIKMPKFEIGVTDEELDSHVEEVKKQWIKESTPSPNSSTSTAPPHRASSESSVITSKTYEMKTKSKPFNETSGIWSSLDASSVWAYLTEGKRFTVPKG